MNTLCHQQFEKNRCKSDFPACQKSPLLLKTKKETAMMPFQQQRSFKFTGLFERWSTPTSSQAGVFLLRLTGGSRGSSHCGLRVAEPQDTVFDKIKKMRRLANVA
jgi:hypothetical protein